MLLNISTTCYQMGDYARAREHYALAQSLDPERVRQFAYLGERRAEEARAAEERDPAYEILFLEE
ncbi:MAG: hypothetical protein JXB06_03485 [Spirochaetales bacterium]|nr:hypothetical protein [Spirochaetales bacterium]